MRTWSLAVFFTLVGVAAACSSSTSSPGAGGDGGASSGSGSSSGGGSGGGSGSSSGGGSGSSSGSGSGGGGDAGDGRAVATCAQADAAAQAGGGNIQPGSWGSIPPALQQLPPGATLCGTAYNGPADASSNAGYTYLLSDLSGTALTSFYTPLVAQVSGCGQLTAIAGGAAYSFTCTGGVTGSIIPAPALQILELGYH